VTSSRLRLCPWGVGESESALVRVIGEARSLDGGRWTSLKVGLCPPPEPVGNEEFACQRRLELRCVVPWGVTLESDSGGGDGPSVALRVRQGVLRWCQAADGSKRWKAGITVRKSLGIKLFEVESQLHQLRKWITVISRRSADVHLRLERTERAGCRGWRRSISVVRKLVRGTVELTLSGERWVSLERRDPPMLSLGVKCSRVLSVLWTADFNTLERSLKLELDKSMGIRAKIVQRIGDSIGRLPRDLSVTKEFLTSPFLKPEIEFRHRQDPLQRSVHLRCSVDSLQCSLSLTRGMENLLSTSVSATFPIGSATSSISMDTTFRTSTLLSIALAKPKPDTQSFWQVSVSGAVSADMSTLNVGAAFWY